MLDTPIDMLLKIGWISAVAHPRTIAGITVTS